MVTDTQHQLAEDIALLRQSVVKLKADVDDLRFEGLFTRLAVLAAFGLLIYHFWTSFAE